jgi:2-hydroxychromene-2-carboxylate isomerase
VDDREALRRHLDANRVESEPIMRRLDAPEVDAELMQNCQEAADRGAFGAPTFFVHSADGETQMHFGQDRLDFVEEALAIP